MASRVTRSRRGLPQQPEQQQSRARWTNGLTKMFAHLMVDQVHRGNRINNSFSKKAWKFMCDEFYQKTGLQWDKEQLKNKYAVLRRQHSIVRSLLDQREFSLDESKGIIIANNEAWAEYIKGHPDAEPIKNGGCSIYKQLCLIFSESLTNGKHYQSDDKDEKNPSSVPDKEPLNTIQEEDSSSESKEADDMTDVPDTFQPAMHSATANRKRGRSGIEDAIAGAILQMTAASKLRTAAIKQINARYSVADCVKVLDGMRGVEEKLYFAALNLFDNRNAREIFLSLKGDKRLIWLRGKCTAHPLP